MTKVTGYTPTPEQLEAQKAAEEAARKASRFGGKTIPDPANPGKYISQTAAETAAKAGKQVKPTGKTSKGLLSKIGKFFKGKGGKIGAISVGIAALISGGIYLFNKLTGKKDTPAQEEAVTPTPTPEETPETPDTPVAPTPTPEETPETPVAPPAEQEDTPVNPPATATIEEEVPDNTVPKDYTVKEGDCVWNIAKQHLKDMNPDPNYKPSNAEILKHTKELMELNQLEFEPDGYHVMIRPKDKLKLTA